MHEGKRVSHPAAFVLAARIARWTARTWWLWLLMMTVATCLVVSLEVPSFHTIVGGTYHPDAMTMNAELAGQVSQEWLDAPSSTAAEERAKEDARARAAAYADYLAAAEDRGRIGAAIKLMELSLVHPPVGQVRAEAELELAFYQSLLETEEPRLYGSLDEMPAFVLLSSRWQDHLYVPLLSDALDVLARPADVETGGETGREAYVLALVPMIAAIACTTRWRAGERLLGAAPVARGLVSALGVGISAAAGWLAVALTRLPLALVAALRNGIGDPSHPVAFFREGEPVLTTAGATLAATAAFYLLVALFLALVVELGLVLTHRLVVGVAACALIALVPLIPGHYGSLSPLGDLLPWLPSTYLDAPRVTGGWGYQVNMLNSLVPDARIAPLTGVLVLGVSSAVLATALSVALLFQSRRAVLHRTGGGGAFGEKNVRPGAPARGAHFSSGRSHAVAREGTGLLAVCLLVLRRGALLPCLAVLALVACLAPGALGFRTGMDSFTQEAYGSRYRQASLALGADGTVPSAAEEEEVARLREVAFASDDAAFAREAAAFEAWRAGRIRAGELGEDGPLEAGEAEARAEYFSALASSGDPRVLLSAAELSPFSYLGFVSTLIPPALMAAPAAAVGAVLVWQAQRGLIRQVPIRGRRLFREVAASVAFPGSGVCLGAWTVDVLVALVRNGLGDPSQPCLFVAGGELIVKSSFDAALAWILWSLALCLVCSLACALFAVFLCRDTRRARGTFGKELRHAQR